MTKFKTNGQNSGTETSLYSYSPPLRRLASGSRTPLRKAAMGSWTQERRLSMLWRWGSFSSSSRYALSWWALHSRAAMLWTNSGTRQV